MSVWSYLDDETPRNLNRVFQRQFENGSNKRHAFVQNQDDRELGFFKTNPSTCWFLFFPNKMLKELSPLRAQIYSDDLATRAKAASVQYHHGYREGSYWRQRRSLRRADQQCVQRRRSPILEVVKAMRWSREAPKMKEDGHNEHLFLFYINLQFWFQYRFSYCNPCKPDMCKPDIASCSKESMTRGPYCLTWITPHCGFMVFGDTRVGGVEIVTS